METLLAIVSAVSVGGAVVLGILYGRAAAANAELVEKAAIAELDRTVARAAVTRLTEVLASRKRYITSLEQTLVNKADPTELARMFNRLLSDSPHRDTD